MNTEQTSTTAHTRYVIHARHDGLYDVVGHDLARYSSFYSITEYPSVEACVARLNSEVWGQGQEIMLRALDGTWSTLQARPVEVVGA